MEAGADPRVPQHAGGATVEAADELFVFFRNSERSRSEGQATVSRTVRSAAARSTSPQSVKAQSAASAAFQRGEDNVRRRLAELTMPVVVANGMQDRMLPAVRSFIIATHAPDAKLVLYPDAGCGFLFQQINGFAGEVDRFLSADTDPTWT